MVSIIRSGRCDQCQRRKRKCDEKKPSCSGCLDRKFICRYTNSVSRFVNTFVESEIASGSQPSMQHQMQSCQSILTVQSSKTAPSGEGSYYVLKALRHATKAVPQVSLVSSSASLASQFASALSSATSAGLHLHHWGAWMSHIPRRIGVDPLLDLAVACLVKAHEARYTEDSELNLYASRQLYGKALLSLRERVIEGRVDEYIIATIKLLTAFEMMVIGVAHGWLSHAYGAIKMFSAAGPSTCRNEFARSLYWATAPQALQPAMMTGNASVFDTAEWRSVEEASDECDGDVYTACPQQVRFLNRIPRLIASIRVLRRYQNNRKMVSGIIALITELMDFAWEEESDQHEVPLGPTTNAEDAAIIPVSWKYGQDGFGVAMRRAWKWTSKIILSNLCQSLHDLDAAPPSLPSTSECRHEELQCALRICMTIETVRAVLPYGAAQMVFPLQVAWGAFHRLTRTQSWYSAKLLCASPAAMMEFVRSRAEFFLGALKPVELTTPALIFLAERLQGDVMRPIGTFSGEGNLTSNVALHDLARSVHSEDHGEETISRTIPRWRRNFDGSIGAADQLHARQADMHSFHH